MVAPWVKKRRKYGPHRRFCSPEDFCRPRSQGLSDPTPRRWYPVRKTCSGRVAAMKKPARGRLFHWPMSRLSALHRVEELLVGLAVLHLVEHELDGGDFVHRVQQLAQDPDLLQHVRRNQEILATGAGAVDVDGRIDAFFADATTQVHLHVAGALELLVDH